LLALKVVPHAQAHAPNAQSHAKSGARRMLARHALGLLYTRSAGRTVTHAALIMQRWWPCGDSAQRSDPLQWLD